MSRRIPVVPHPPRGLRAAAIAAAGVVMMAPGVAGAQQQAPCVTSVAIGDLAATVPSGSCFRREGLVWITDGDVDLGGLALTESSPGRGTLVMDPFNARVSAAGYAGQVGGIASKIPVIGLMETGTFTITFQKTAQAQTDARYYGPAGGQAIKLTDIARIPGLAGVAGLPTAREPGGKELVGLPDYARVAEDDVMRLEESGTIRGGVLGATVEVPLATVGLPGFEPFIFTLPKSMSFLGVRLDGAVEVLPAKSAVDGAFGMRVRVDAEVSGGWFGDLDGLQGEVEVFAAPGGVVRADAVGFEAAQVGLGTAVMFKPLRLRYTRADNSWDGATTVYMPWLSQSSGFGGSWRIVGGTLQSLGLTLPAPIPLGPYPFAIRRFTGVADWAPTFRISGGAKVTSYPDLGTTEGVGMEGTLTYEHADADGSTPWEIRVDGEYSLLGKTFGRSTSRVTASEFSTEVQLDAEVKRAVRLKGRVAGNVTWRPSSTFNLSGSVELRWADWRLTAQGIVSDRAVAVCGKARSSLLGDFDIGGAYMWREKTFRWLDASCDLGPYRSEPKVVATPAQAAQGVHDVYLRPPATGEYEGIAVKLVGLGRAPEVTAITGGNTARGDEPGGKWSRTYAVAPDPTRLVIEGEGYLITKDPDTRTTTVLIARPANGSLWVENPWFLVSTASDDPFRQGPEISYVKPGPTATGSVGDGRLTVATDVPQPPYSDNSRQARQRGVEGADPAPNPTVRLIERGPGVERVLRTYREDDDLRGLHNARQPDVSMRFAPARGPAGNRRIIAVVEEYGTVREEIVVARFRAKRSTLARPGVSVTRTGPTTARVRWTRVPGATGYRLVIGMNGDIREVTTGARATSLNLDGVVPESGVSARVRATSTFPAEGPAGSGTARRVGGGGAGVTPRA